MRDEYDLKKLEVKRRGILPGLQGQRPEEAKLSITIALDEDVVEYFQAEMPNTESLQTQINQMIRRGMQTPKLIADTEAIKRTLLQDSNFLRELANKIDHLQNYNASTL